MNESINKYKEERPWGKFEKFTQNRNSTVKIITVNPNASLSLQSHTKRSEFWRVISGGGIFFIDGLEHKVEKGSEYYVDNGVKHRIIGGPNGMEILEIGLGDFDESDIVRYEDNYGRI